MSINFKSMFNKVKDGFNKGVDAYDSATKKAEEWTMDKFGSKKSLDTVVDEGIDVAINTTKEKIAPAVKEKVVCATNKVVDKIKDIPLAIPHVFKKRDVWTNLAQDEELAAALRYVHSMRTAIEVVSVQVVEAPIPATTPVVVDDRPPMVRPTSNSNAALMPGVAQVAVQPAPMSTVSKVKGYVRRVVGAPAPTVVVPE